MQRPAARPRRSTQWLRSNDHVHLQRRLLGGDWLGRRHGRPMSAEEKVEHCASTDARGAAGRSYLKWKVRGPSVTASARSTASVGHQPYLECSVWATQCSTHTQ